MTTSAAKAMASTAASVRGDGALMPALRKLEVKLERY